MTVQAETLFSLPSDSFAPTSDDAYTPRWVFEAMSLRFDLDVAAPPEALGMSPRLGTTPRRTTGSRSRGTGWCGATRRTPASLTGPRDGRITRPGS